ncbi:hypothetical protein H6G27_33460 [Nostoc linckia FACHB-104]|nr:hypothetical protein [Nostoc linckia FACHB-104]
MFKSLAYQNWVFSDASRQSRSFSSAGGRTVMWRYIFLALKHLLSTGLSIVAVFVSGLACAATREALRGKNYSDVGVPMYENDGIATLVGLLVFLIILFGFLYVLQRTLSQNLQWLPYLVAIITCIFASPFLLIAVFW